jgi:FtsH-binding integral membrane protein
MKSIVPVYLAWLGTLVMLILAVSGTIQTRTSHVQHGRSHNRPGYTRSHGRDFYTALRWVSCAAFAYSAVVASQMQLTFWAWVFGLLAILFNPIIPVYLQRQFWQIIDYVAIATIFLAAIVFTRNVPNDSDKPSSRVS